MYCVTGRKKFPERKQARPLFGCFLVFSVPDSRAVFHRVAPSGDGFVSFKFCFISSFVMANFWKLSASEYLPQVLLFFLFLSFSLPLYVSIFPSQTNSSPVTTLDLRKHSGTLFFCSHFLFAIAKKPSCQEISDNRHVFRQDIEFRYPLCTFLTNPCYFFCYLLRAISVKKGLLTTPACLPPIGLQWRKCDAIKGSSSAWN